MENLSVGYGAKEVLEKIDLSVGQGRFVSLLGPNGAGKTTLLRTLARLLAPLKGAVFVEGRNLAGLGQADLARIQAAVLTERPRLGLLTARQLVGLGRHPHTGLLGRLSPKDKAVVERSLELVGATELTDRVFDRLSDGERQKIFLARALAQEPKIIILDEPTIHLDLKHRLEVMAILRRLCLHEGLTIIASLHDLDTAARVSDLVGLIKDGRVLAWGPPERVLSEASVRRTFDLDSASYNPRLGILEPGGDPAGHPGRPEVFVAAGGGSGAGLFRLLAKRGFPLLTGPLQKHDLDYQVARSLGARIAACEPFMEADPEKLAAARMMSDRAGVLVQADYPLAPATRAVESLIRRALGQGRRVLSLKGDAEPGAITFADELSLADHLRP